MDSKPVLEALCASREHVNRFMYLILHVLRYRPQILIPGLCVCNAVYLYVVMYLSNTNSLENVAKSWEFLEICTETKYYFILVFFCPVHLFGEYFAIPHIIKEGCSTYATPATCLSDCAVMLNRIYKS